MSRVTQIVGSLPRDATQSAVFFVATENVFFRKISYACKISVLVLDTYGNIR